MSNENPEEYFSRVEEEKIEYSKTEETPEVCLAQSLERVSRFNPQEKDGQLRKMLLQERLADIRDTLGEGGEEGLTMLIAYRGLEEIAKQNVLGEDDFGVQKAMDILREKVRAQEGFDLSEVEDLDQLFQQTHGEVKKALAQDFEGLSYEETTARRGVFEKYFALKREIQERQQQITGESRNFYQAISKKISGPLLAFLDAKGKKVDAAMKSSPLTLLRQVGNYGLGSKFARGVGLSIIVAGAFGYIFKGELSQAAQFDNDTPEKSGNKIANGWISPEELKLKDPEMYNLLMQQGFIQKSGIEITDENEPEKLEEKKTQPLSQLFERALRKTEAARLLETDEYKKADTPRELRSLYQKFNEKDDDPSDDLAVREKYDQFLRSYSKEEMIEKYGRQEIEKIYQEAGYVNFKSLEKYFKEDIKDKKVDTESLNGYLHGFKIASDFYKNSLDLSREYVKDGKLNKALVGLIDMNNALGKIANTTMIYGDIDDKGIAASMRNLIGQNVLEFNRLEGKVNIVNLGEEKFLFLNPDVLGNLIHKDVGGMGISTAWAAESVNEGIAARRFSPQEMDFINILADEKILIKTKNGFIANPEKPYLLFALPDTYPHENQHYEFAKNDNLIKYWVREWNSLDKKSREEFVSSLCETGVYLRGIHKNEIKSLLENNLSFEEMKEINSKDLQGIEMSRPERFKMSVLQEFQAYSTDNLLRTHIDLKHEVPLQH